MICSRYDCDGKLTEDARIYCGHPDCGFPAPPVPTGLDHTDSQARSGNQEGGCK